MDKRLKKLRIYNLIVGFVLLVQGLVMWTISSASEHSLPITTNYIKWNDYLQYPESLQESIGEIKIGLIVAIFLLLSGLFLLLVATIGNKAYNRWISKGINPFRWIEYSITSSLMIIVIAMLCGVYDLSSLIMIGALNASMILFGWMMEIHNQTTKKTNWTAFTFGCLVGAIPWIILGMYFFNAVNSNGSAMPDFVYWIFGSIFICFNIFAINMVLQYEKIGKWKDYIYGEYMFITLSLVAKALLAWQVWGGTLR